MSEEANVRAVSAQLRVGVSVLSGIVVGAILELTSRSPMAPIIAWDTAALVYLLWMWLTIGWLSPSQTKHLAGREDPGRTTADGLLVAASVASLVVVGYVLVKAGQSEGGVRAGLVALGIISIILSWAVVHTIFTLRYARLYYAKEIGGVDFNQPQQPSYSDFAYLAFIIGMTFQVADTNITDHRIRVTVLQHALLSYVFGTIIVAATINLIASII